MWMLRTILLKQSEYDVSYGGICAKKRQNIRLMLRAREIFVGGIF
jgi:hypothetical protein